MPHVIGLLCVGMTAAVLGIGPASAPVTASAIGSSAHCHSHSRGAHCHKSARSSLRADSVDDETAAGVAVAMVVIALAAVA